MPLHDATFLRFFGVGEHEMRWATGETRNRHDLVSRTSTPIQTKSPMALGVFERLPGGTHKGKLTKNIFSDFLPPPIPLRIESPNTCVHKMYRTLETHTKYIRDAAVKR